jgi:hypothetical protein
VQQSELGKHTPTGNYRLLRLAIPAAAVVRCVSTQPSALLGDCQPTRTLLTRSQRCARHATCKSVPYMQEPHPRTTCTVRARVATDSRKMARPSHVLEEVDVLVDVLLDRNHRLEEVVRTLAQVLRR